MTDSTNRPPLWRVMHDAYNREEWDTRDGIGLVGEIDAVVQWIEQQQLADYAVILPDVGGILDVLREEAVRARKEIESLDEAWE